MTHPIMKLSCWYFGQQWLVVLINTRYGQKENLPPSKNCCSTNSAAPNSSKPTATNFTLTASKVGRRVLIFTAPSRQNCHPNRLRNMIITVLSAHSDSSDTFWRRETNTDCKNICQLDYCVPLSYENFAQRFFPLWK